MKEDGLVIESETIGFRVADAKLGLNYSSCEVRDSWNAPRRSEMFRLNGREKSKICIITDPNENVDAENVEPDSLTGGRQHWTKIKLLGIAHTEIDPFGLPLVNSVGVMGRLSHIQELMADWKSGMSLKGEVFENGKLEARFVSNRGDVMIKQIYDDKFGGMPVVYRIQSIDRNRKVTKKEFYETKVYWRERDGSWIPSKVDFVTDCYLKSSNVTVKINVASNEKRNEFIGQVDWSKLFREDSSQSANWNTILTDKLKALHLFEDE
ncbi:MAG: hypothetical protein MUC43_15120 [Pirellula sp.]|jgi:hypothetical protein|nr:hypothetical protein [Pirellula sp.]